MGKFMTTGLPCTHDASKSYQYIVCGIHKAQFDKLYAAHAIIATPVMIATASTSTVADVSTIIASADASTTDASTIMPADTLSTEASTSAAVATADKSSDPANTNESSANANESATIANESTAAAEESTAVVGKSTTVAAESTMVAAGSMVVADASETIEVAYAAGVSANDVMWMGSLRWPSVDRLVAFVWSRFGRACVLSICLLLIVRYLGKKRIG